MSKVICVSYFPTSQSLSEFDIDNLNIEQVIYNIAHVRITVPNGCVWVLCDTKVSPILIVENAEIIHRNMQAWSENEPSKWFYFGFKINDVAYSIGLFPNLTASLERFKNRQTSINDEIITDDDQIKLIYHPLGFVSGIDNINKVKDKFEKTINIGLAESMDDINNDVVHWVNDITIYDKHQIQYIDDYLEVSLSEPSNGPGKLCS